MGFTKADFPPVEPETFLQQPLIGVPFGAGDRKVRNTHVQVGAHLWLDAQAR